MVSVTEKTICVLTRSVSGQHHLKATRQLHAQFSSLPGWAVAGGHGIAPRRLELLLGQLSIQCPVEGDQYCHQLLQVHTW